MQMILFWVLVLHAFLAVKTGPSGKCTKSNCFEEELEACSSAVSQKHCLKNGGIYFAYKKTYNPQLTHNTCCYWNLKSLTNKNLACVTSAQTQEYSCENKKTGKETMKIKTSGGCNRLYCSESNNV